MTEMKSHSITEQLPEVSFFKRCFEWCARFFLWCGWGIVLAVLLIIVIDGLTGYYVKDAIYTDISKLPKHDYAVVLGTSKYYSKGSPNLYYKYRLDAATALFKQRKVKRLLVSGDNQTPYYNEPKVMTDDLRKMGVKAEFIEQDFAGYRTLDSVVRASQVYKLDPFVIVTQQFHCERALFIAKYHHINAVCFAAEHPEGHIRVRAREFLARIGMVWDFISGTKPETFEKTRGK